MRTQRMVRSSGSSSAPSSGSASGSRKGKKKKKKKYRKETKGHCANYAYPNGKNYDMVDAGRKGRCMKRCQAKFPASKHLYIHGKKRSCGCCKDPPGPWIADPQDTGYVIKSSAPVAPGSGSSSAPVAPGSGSLSAPSSGSASGSRKGEKKRKKKAIKKKGTGKKKVAPESGPAKLPKNYKPPPKANPAPLDFYKVPGKILNGAGVTCAGLMALPIAKGNLEACARTCRKCKLCKGFIDDGDGGVCSFKSSKIHETCMGDRCTKDGYMKCPSGTWSDGVSTDPTCSKAAFGFRRELGTGPWVPGGTSLACNKGETTLQVPDNDLSKCANMCRNCNIGGSQCEAFVRTQSKSGKGSACTFKSLFVTGTKVGSGAEAYRTCPAGKWADGLSTKCTPAPVGYAVAFGKDGGNTLKCNSGRKFMKIPRNGDLNVCAKVCNKCMVGIKTCNGFVIKNGKCHFMTASTTSKDKVNKVLGGKVNFQAATYFRCPGHQVSSGSDAVCSFPNDFQITVSTGKEGSCTCNERDVGNKRLSSSKWTFDVLDAQDVPLFVKEKPFIQAPCADENDKNCLRAVSANFTAEAGANPKAVRISVDKDDDWCMKTFCIHSPTLKKRWVPKKPQPNFGFNGGLYMNPGVTEGGSCAPQTTAFPNNNWGWCRFISATDSKTTQASMNTCNTVQDYKRAFWQLALVEEKGDCSNIPVKVPLTPAQKQAAAEAKAAADKKKLEQAQEASGAKPVTAGAVATDGVVGGCPREIGFCVTDDNKDRNSGVTKLITSNMDTRAEEAACVKKCQATPGATGCEVIKKPGGGCYVHTAPIAKGNNVADHACWVFSKCNKGGKGGGQATS